MSYHYPVVEDWEQRWLDESPWLGRVEPARSLGLVFAARVQRIDSDLGSIASVLASPSDAYGWVLDLVGSRYGEGRGGLADGEYQRIVEGRRLAQDSTGALPDVTAVWTALVGLGAQPVRVDRYYTPAPTVPTALYEAILPSAPSTAWLARAGVVLSDAVAYGVGDVSAVVGTPSTMVWGEGEWGVGEWGYPLGTT